jgi:hypothetical protein
MAQLADMSDVGCVLQRRKSSDSLPALQRPPAASIFRRQDLAASRAPASSGSLPVQQVSAAVERRRSLRLWLAMSKTFRPLRSHSCRTEWRRSHAATSEYLSARSAAPACRRCWPACSAERIWVPRGFLQRWGSLPAEPLSGKLHWVAINLAPAGPTCLTERSSLLRWPAAPKRVYSPVAFPQGRAASLAHVGVRSARRACLRELPACKDLGALAF